MQRPTDPIPLPVCFAASSPAPSRWRSAGAFTLVELLAVIGIIAFLIGILLVAFGGALKSSRDSTNQRTLGVIGAAVESFNADFRYHPPLLMPDAPPSWRLGDAAPADSTAVVAESWNSGGSGPATPAQIRANLTSCRYGSEYSLAVYIMGAGDLDGVTGQGGGFANSPTPNTGVNENEDDGVAGPGIRDPGPDRSWGGAIDRSQQTPISGSAGPRAIRTGRVYGPYLDPTQMADFLELDPNIGLFKVVDSFRQPVRYYKGWPVKSRPTANAPAEQSVGFVPVELRSARAVDEHAATGVANVEFERDVLNAPYIVLGAGKPTIFTNNSGREQRPVPMFGDRLRDPDNLPAEITGLESFTTLHQPNFEDRFDPSTIGSEARVRLIEDLADNQRYTP